MIKIYASGAEEKRLLPILAEFKARVFLSRPVKGHTRKHRKTGMYRVVNFPIQ